jgi:pyruvate kinase
MKRQRNAKIIATLGPASADEQTIRALAAAGADVFRVNFSHGSHAEHEHRVAIIRRIETELGRPIGIMMDLQGPKLRVGRFAAGPVLLEHGQSFRLDLEDLDGDASRVCLPHPEIFAAVDVGADLLVNDGRIQLRITRKGDGWLDTEVVVGGEISDRKGVNVPGVVLPLSPLTEKDREDLMFGLSLEVDWVALSFVQRAEDVEELRTLVGGRAAVLAKLEKPAAIDSLDAVVQASDAVMVARGDLGVELPPQELPRLQKRISQLGRRLGKPVVIATHMLDSMVSAPVPTRAEASDVANAVYDGVDAVMLSAESAAGQYPVQAVRMMDQIIQKVEKDPHYRKTLDAHHPDPDGTDADAVCCALRRMTHVVGAVVNITYTSSGSTALRAARERPDAPILALTPNRQTARRLALSWGAQPVVVETVESVQQMVETARREALARGFAVAGDAMVIAAGLPFGAAGTTNTVHIARI